MKKFLALVVLILGVSGGSVSEFCWKESYGRGVGTVPTRCDQGRDRIGLLCYSSCPPNMARFGFDCHSVCPPGWANQGLFCRLSEYGRGAGYPWQFGDPLNDSGMFKRCERDNGAGQCENNGPIVYPKCKPGYSSVGCCICRPNVPDCSKYNMNPGIDLSCAKKIIIGDPVTGSCGSDDKNGGLCYPKCANTFNGVGPVCWGTPPAGWVDCGMGAAKSSMTCAQTIVSQVQSVGSLAINIASLGSTGAATAGGKASRLSQITEKFKKMKDIFDKKTKVLQEMKALKDKFDILSNYVEVATTDDVVAEDIVRVSAEMASLIDPSGVADVVAAYTYPKCSKI